MAMAFSMFIQTSKMVANVGSVAFSGHAFPHCSIHHTGFEMRQVHEIGSSLTESRL